MLWLKSWPVDRPLNRLGAVNRPLASEHLQDIRQAMARGVPLGGDGWKVRMAGRLGLQATLRPPGCWPNKPLKTS